MPATAAIAPIRRKPGGPGNTGRTRPAAVTCSASPITRRPIRSRERSRHAGRRPISPALRPSYARATKVLLTLRGARGARACRHRHQLFASKGASHEFGARESRELSVRSLAARGGGRDQVGRSGQGRRAGDGFSKRPRSQRRARIRPQRRPARAAELELRRARQARRRRRRRAGRQPRAL